MQANHNIRYLWNWFYVALIKTSASFSFLFFVIYFCWHFILNAHTARSYYTSSWNLPEFQTSQRDISRGEIFYSNRGVDEVVAPQSGYPLMHDVNLSHGLTSHLTGQRGGESTHSLLIPVDVILEAFIQAHNHRGDMGWLSSPLKQKNFSKFFSKW